MAFENIDAKALADVLANSRERGVYEREGNSFLEAEVAGAKVDLENGAFAGKQATSVAAGFRNLANKEAYKGKLRVVANDEGIYLINLELV